MANAAVNTAPLGAVATLRVVDAVLNLKNSVVAWNEARETRKVLSRLSDDQLQDIGLTRADLF
ncbi:MAG: DUF1127 domain-containing protein [Rhodobacteraceae bacterium]|jgi:uncharacterized protein YjiS (DUF1127 family)|nr:DUF1127 domain-containing protein [Paracoccaceae bacterium]